MQERDEFKCAHDQTSEACQQNNSLFTSDYFVGAHHMHCTWYSHLKMTQGMECQGYSFMFFCFMRCPALKQLKKAKNWRQTRQKQRTKTTHCPVDSLDIKLCHLVTMFRFTAGMDFFLLCASWGSFKNSFLMLWSATGSSFFAWQCFLLHVAKGKLAILPCTKTFWIAARIGIVFFWRNDFNATSGVV